MLDEDAKQLRKMKNTHDYFLLQSLQRGSVRPPAPNGCTYIPGRSKDQCKINGKGLAGRPGKRTTTAFSQFMHEST